MRLELHELGFKSKEVIIDYITPRVNGFRYFDLYCLFAMICPALSKMELAKEEND